MGSFQQVLLGATCLVAAFFFGSYLHNRPASTEAPADRSEEVRQLADSVFPFGMPDKSNSSPARDSANAISQDVAGQSESSSPRQPFATVASQTGQASQSDSSNEASVADFDHRPVAPDFSDLAARFRNSPLELDESGRGAARADQSSPIHESERVPQAQNGFDLAPEFAITQPQNLTPLTEFKVQARRVETGLRKESSDSNPNRSTGRWRVNRSDDFATEQPAEVHNHLRATPQPDVAAVGPTVDEVIESQSANYLLESDESTQTFATDPMRSDIVASQRQLITRQASERHQDILNIDDPGNRFMSVLDRSAHRAQPSRPEPDFATDYYAPVNPDFVAKPKQDKATAPTSNWQRRSNVRSEFEKKTYLIQPGDTLQSISTHFYGKPNFYLEIYKANRKVLDRISSSHQGIEIEIPNLNN